VSKKLRLTLTLDVPEGLKAFDGMSFAEVKQVIIGQFENEVAKPLREEGFVCLIGIEEIDNV
jgi:hypothetical protein